MSTKQQHPSRFYLLTLFGRRRRRRRRLLGRTIKSITTGRSHISLVYQHSHSLSFYIQKYCDLSYPALVSGFLLLFNEKINERNGQYTRRGRRLRNRIQVVKE